MMFNVVMGKILNNTFAQSKTRIVWGFNEKSSRTWTMLVVTIHTRKVNALQETEEVD